MILFKKIPKDILDLLPKLITVLRNETNIAAYYLFGSAVNEKLKPLSDIDFAVLISQKLKRDEIFNYHLNLIGVISDTLHIDDFDLVILNTAPPRFAYNILKSGRLLFCKDKEQTIDFMEKTNKYYLDFKYYKDQFNSIFQEKIGINR